MVHTLMSCCIYCHVTKAGKVLTRYIKCTPCKQKCQPPPWPVHGANDHMYTLAWAEQHPVKTGSFSGLYVPAPTGQTLQCLLHIIMSVCRHLKTSFVTEWVIWLRVEGSVEDECIIFSFFSGVLVNLAMHQCLLHIPLENIQVHSKDILYTE